jgi:hypothetical protein
LCQEDTYLLELVRYIQLNPLRAKLVKSLTESDKYPYSGHSALKDKADFADAQPAACGFEVRRPIQLSDRRFKIAAIRDIP